MTITLIIIIYLIGAVLAYGRAFASTNKLWFAVFVGFCSWIGFVSSLSERERSEKFLQFREPRKSPVKSKRYIGVQDFAVDITYDFENHPPKAEIWRGK